MCMYEGFFFFFFFFSFFLSWMLVSNDGICLCLYYFFYLFFTLLALFISFTVNYTLYNARAQLLSSFSSLEGEKKKGGKNYDILYITMMLLFIFSSLGSFLLNHHIICRRLLGQLILSIISCKLLVWIYDIELTAVIIHSSEKIMHIICIVILLSYELIY